MRVAIVHYHFKRGGVTRVVESLCNELGRLSVPPEVALLSGGDPSTEAISGTVFVEGLGYTEKPPFPNPHDLLDQVDAAARQTLGGPPDIWHIHNPTLGKNAVWPDWIRLLAERGDPLFLQIHDFAEDARPANFRYRQSHTSNPSTIFPVREGIHYGVINRRDFQFLTDFGIPAQNLHSLPNPVSNSFGETGRPIPTPGNRPLVLYPVRALRRKNLGELLLAAASDPEDRFYATSLGPTNPAYHRLYNEWKRVASAHRLPVALGFNETANHPFQDLIATADSIITTSVGEGFGLSFLEPWLFHRPIRGRNLPAVTADFATAGIDLGPLYESLPIPKEWIDLELLRVRFEAAVKSTYEAFDRNIPEQQIGDCWLQWSSGAFIDFGKLDEPAQIAIIERVAAGTDLPVDTARYLHFAISDESPRIESNRRKIEETFAPTAYAEKVLSAWNATLSDRPATVSADPVWLRPEPLVEAFLAPVSTSLLRIG